MRKLRLGLPDIAGLAAAGAVTIAAAVIAGFGDGFRPVALTLAVVVGSAGAVASIWIGRWIRRNFLQQR